jgi:YesN/AraC family two-component response regulator
MEFFQKDNKVISLLYVEDDPITRKLLQKAISRKFPTIKIHSAENGKAGLELFKKTRPDIVLTDIDLPEMNGIMMASELRKLTSKTEIILISGREKERYESDIFKIGISHYLNKPIQNEILYKIIEDTITCIMSKRKRRKQRAQDQDNGLLIPHVVLQS